MKPAGSHWQSLRSLRGGTLPKNPPTDGTAVPSGPNPPHHTAHERLSPFYPLSIGESGEGPDVRLTVRVGLPKAATLVERFQTQKCAYLDNYNGYAGKLFGFELRAPPHVQIR